MQQRDIDGNERSCSLASLPWRSTAGGVQRWNWKAGEEQEQLVPASLPSSSPSLSSKAKSRTDTGLSCCCLSPTVLGAPVVESPSSTAAVSACVHVRIIIILSEHMYGS